MNRGDVPSDGAVGLELREFRAKRARGCLRRPRADVLDLGPQVGEVLTYCPPDLAPGSSSVGGAVLLHGAGSDPSAVLAYFTEIADECGLVLVAPRAEAGRHQFEFAGLAGNRFAHPSWSWNPPSQIDGCLDYLRSEVRVDHDRCFLIGSSMGAVATWNVAMRKSDYAGFVCVNGVPSVWERFGPDKVVDWLRPNLADALVLSLHGSEDQRFPQRFVQSVAKRVAEVGASGVTLLFVEGAGHSLQEMGLHPGTFHHEKVRKFCGSVRRNALPENYAFRFVGPFHDRYHWTEYWPEGDHLGSLRVSIDGDVLYIDSVNVRRLRLHLNSAVLSPGPVRVLIDGSELEFVFEPNLAGLRQSLESYSDARAAGEQVVDFVLDESGWA